MLWGRPALDFAVILTKCLGCGPNPQTSMNVIDQKTGKIESLNRKTLRLSVNYGGEGGIRTHDTLAGMPHFECGAFDHSATSPHARTLALRAPLKHQWPG
jgi:hypothetical protein